MSVHRSVQRRQSKTSLNRRRCFVGKDASYNTSTSQKAGETQQSRSGETKVTYETVLGPYKKPLIMKREESLAGSNEQGNAGPGEDYGLNKDISAHSVSLVNVGSVSDQMSDGRRLN